MHKRTIGTVIEMASSPVRDPRNTTTAMTFYVATAYAQALYYALTGIWPLVSLRSFERVTGPKADGWLVKTVGVLITVLGAVLALAGYRRTTAPEVPLLAGGSALGLAAIDVIYVAKRRISPIYLLDGAAEVGLAATWAILFWRTGVSIRKPPR